ncbi:MAG: hypothetical protein D6704_09680 [Nitrospirae bacterium]|nr:MAG: hypothetical protein D6704_09680 [Nitrospirota bacterium]
MPPTRKAHKFATCRQTRHILRKTGTVDFAAIPEEISVHLKQCLSCMQWHENLRATLTIFGTRVDVRTPPAIRRYVERRHTPTRQD